MSRDHTTIRVSAETKERLKDYGDMGMSYDDVVQELLDRVDESENETAEQ